MMNNLAQHPAARPPGKEHIPTYPPGFIAIRIVQLVLAVIILGLAAYGISISEVDGISLTLAVSVLTLVSSIYHMIAHWGVPAAYNYWAILGLDIFFVVMWLCSFALLAARVADSYSYYDYYGLSSYYRSYYGVSSEVDVVLATQAAAAGLGGVEFILFIVSLVIHSIRLHRHRAAGLHCMPPSVPTGLAPPGAVVLPAGVPVIPPYADKNGASVPGYQPFPPQQPIPAYIQGGYPAPPPGTFMVPAPMPMPMPGQQMQMQMPPPQQGFYAPVPQPSQSPPPQPIVPQPTGSSHVTSLASQPPVPQQPVQQQPPQQQHQQQGQVPPQQLPGDEH